MMNFGNPFAGREAMVNALRGGGAVPAGGGEVMRPNIPRSQSVQQQGQQGTGQGMDAILGAMKHKQMMSALKPAPGQAPAGATEMYGQGMGVFRPEAVGASPPGAASGGMGALGPAGMVAGAMGGMAGVDNLMEKKGGYDALNKLSVNGVGGGDVAKSINPMSYIDDPEDSIRNLVKVFTLGLAK